MRLVLPVLCIRGRVMPCNDAMEAQGNDVPCLVQPAGWSCQTIRLGMIKSIAVCVVAARC